MGPALSRRLDLMASKGLKAVENYYGTNDSDLTQRLGCICEHKLPVKENYVYFLSFTA